MKIRKISFTGSTRTGQLIMKMAAESNLKKVALELGGKSPNIIFDDAELAQAVKWSFMGLFYNHGQCCCAGSRIYVQEGIYDAFVKQYAAMAQEYRVGDPFETSSQHGPLTSQVHMERVLGYIDLGKKEGARCVAGGARVEGKSGYYVQPTVFADCKDEMTVVREEIFGPVAVILKFKTMEEVRCLKLCFVEERIES